MRGNVSYWTERNVLDFNIKVFIWSMTGDDESNFDGLEHNLFQLDNTLQNVIGVDKSDWGEKELNLLQCEGFNMERDGR